MRRGLDKEVRRGKGKGIAKVSNRRVGRGKVGEKNEGWKGVVRGEDERKRWGRG